MAINVSDMTEGEHVFTWENPDTKELTHLASGRMVEWCLDWDHEMTTIMVEKHMVPLFLQDRGIEQHRLDRITLVHLLTPILMCDWRDGSHLLVDGHHRYVKAASVGLWRLPAFIMTPDEWEPFVIHGMKPVTTKQLRTGFSGIE